ncbi:MAG: aromatic ring-hydroxylating dioxygenase subunit alpha [Polyangiaceae bacterium]|nr:aromatic ring-hydroxylating dioxygenase subunit alpha [Polyangiaceae bacterium]
MGSDDGDATVRGGTTAQREGLRAFLPRVRKAWYIVATADELGDKPLARTLFGMPVVVFRGEGGKPGVLVDRCPHRNVPLSLGRKNGERLECAYHGWQFDTRGACKLVPSLVGPAEAHSRRATAFPAREQQGFIWMWGETAGEPLGEPHRFAFADVSGYTTVTRRVTAPGTLYSTLENALDVPHTAFLHRGLFRSESRGVKIKAQLRRSADRVEVEYIGEPRPPGIVAKVLSPSGGMVTHFDRFLLPSIAQVEYRIGDENHILVDSVMTPVDDFETAIYAVVSYKMRIPGGVVKPLLEPLAMRVFSQDAKMLSRQSETIKRFGGEHFVSTEIDVIGKHIARLLVSAERGETASAATSDVELVV